MNCVKENQIKMAMLPSESPKWDEKAFKSRIMKEP